METHIIQSKIHALRGQRVMLDFDLSSLYEVPTKALNQAVKRNIERFPEDFMFQLSDEEWQSLRSQIVTLNIFNYFASPIVAGFSKCGKQLQQEFPVLLPRNEFRKGTFSGNKYGSLSI